MTGVHVQRIKKISKLALYLSMLVVPGGSIGFVVLYWLQRGHTKPGETAPDMTLQWSRIAAVWRRQLGSCADLQRALCLPVRIAVPGVLLLLKSSH